VQLVHTLEPGRTQVWQLLPLAQILPQPLLHWHEPLAASALLAKHDRHVVTPLLVQVAQDAAHVLQAKAGMVMR
jgi:hypothetical protein